MTVLSYFHVAMLTSTQESYNGDHHNAIPVCALLGIALFSDGLMSLTLNPS